LPEFIKQQSREFRNLISKSSRSIRKHDKSDKSDKSGKSADTYNKINKEAIEMLKEFGLPTPTINIDPNQHEKSLEKLNDYLYKSSIKPIDQKSKEILKKIIKIEQSHTPTSYE
jgi:arsenate reductase-like glutaredoxin family protein